MDLVFKIEGAPDTPLIGDTNFRQHYSGVNTSMAWADIAPAIRQATEKFVLPYVGDELYDDIANKYNTGANLEPYQAKALAYLQDAVAYYTIYHILPEKNHVIASMGVLQNTPEGGATNAPQWSWKASRWSSLENGDAFLDKLLAYMEKSTEGYFNLYKNSSVYKIKTSDFFRTTALLDEYLNIQMSRRSFISLVRFLRQVEEDIIEPFLCSTLYATLTGTAELSPANKKLLPYIRKAIAYLGAYEAIPHHRLVIDGDGFRVVSQADGFDDRRNMTNNTHLEAIKALQERCQRRGNEAFIRLKDFLETNIDDYPAYRDSPCRVAPVLKGVSIIQSVDGIGTVLIG